MTALVENNKKSLTNMCVAGSELKMGHENGTGLGVMSFFPVGSGVVLRSSGAVSKPDTALCGPGLSLPPQHPHHGMSAQVPTWQKPG